MSDVHAAEAVEKPIIHDESETEARRLGWVAKEEFKGDPEKWRPAEEFLDRGKRILPIVLRDNEKLQRRIGQLEGRLQETLETTKQLVEYHTKGEERAYDRAKRDLEAKAETAAANADTAGVRTAMAEIDALKKQHETPKPKIEPPVQKDPLIQDWIEKESWFLKDKILNTFAGEIYGELERSKPGVSTAELLAETKRRTVEKFPEKFGINPARENPAAVASPTGTASRKRGKSYDDLPEEARRACDKFVRTIPGYSREKYVKDYDWGE